MNKNTFRITALVIAVAALSGGIGYWFATSHGVAQPAMTDATKKTAANERKALYWFDPMMPDQHFDKPGKSPFMDMQLVPQYADDAGSTGDNNADTPAGVKINPAVMQNLGIRLSSVEQAVLPVTVDAVATVQFNDRDIAIVQARSSGFVARVYARAPGDVIDSGAPLVDLVVPDWFAAQNEFLALKSTGDQSLMDAGRQRMHQLGMPADVIAKVEQSGHAQSQVTISSPLGGVIQSLDIRAGMSVAAGAPLARINGLGSVWLEAAIPEAQAGLVAAGMTAQARFAAYPTEKFAGKIFAVLPEANLESHTLRVRVELANQQLRFKPGMFAQLRLVGMQRETALVIPSEAVIRSGTRNLVIIALEGNRFQPVEVTTGRDVYDGNAGKTTILKGLEVGQQVVSSGQFLIDSEASLKGVMARMEHASDANPNASADKADSRMQSAMQSGKMEGKQP
jgi:membrane fusion protein, copper/silver efflux system